MTVARFGTYFHRPFATLTQGAEVAKISTKTGQSYEHVGFSPFSMREKVAEGRMRGLV